MTDPTPIVVTDAMRQAVMREMCDTQGHVYSFVNLLSDRGHAGSTQIRASSDELLPHIFCSRCQKTWIVFDQPGDGYDDAEMKLRERIYKSDPINKRPERVRKNQK